MKFGYQVSSLNRLAYHQNFQILCNTLSCFQHLQIVPLFLTLYSTKNYLQQYLTVFMNKAFTQGWANFSQYFKLMIGRKFKIVDLQSDIGLGLNGKIGTVVGYDFDQEACRVHFKFQGDQTVYKIKMQNFVDPQMVPQEKQQKQKPISMKEIKKCLKVAKQNMKEAQRNISEDRPDIKYRCDKLKEHYEAINKGDYKHSIKCGDFGKESYGKGSYVDQLMNLKPGCVGDGRFRLTDLFFETEDRNRAALRWAQYSISGFCIKCQQHYIQRQPDE